MYIVNTAKSLLYSIPLNRLLSHEEMIITRPFYCAVSHMVSREHTNLMSKRRGFKSLASSHSQSVLQLQALDGYNLNAPTTLHSYQLNKCLTVSRKQQCSASTSSAKVPVFSLSVQF